jgi:hypothetical protein
MAVIWRVFGEHGGFDDNQASGDDGADGDCDAFAVVVGMG